jgi:hypothetical protein
MLAQNVGRIIHAEHIYHNDIFGHNHLLHMVKRECIVMLIKLGMRVSGTFYNGLGCCYQNVADITYRDDKVV